jgi:hypothetical protein
VGALRQEPQGEEVMIAPASEAALAALAYASLPAKTRRS